MLLLIDIGNTNITVGASKAAKLIGNWRISTTSFGTPDEIWFLLHTLFDSESLSVSDFSGASICSVVPKLTSVVKQLLSEKLEIPVINVTNDLELGIKIDYEKPDSVGADRICNAVAGYEKYGGPLVIVDFGTATTFDVISHKGEYLGGIIAPGPETSIATLHAAAAKLPSVELQFPPNLIGKNTETSMQSGIMLGTIAMIDGLNLSLIEELGRSTQLIATGGLASNFFNQLKTVDILEPNLTLTGLQLIFDHCSRKK
tara:strand:+ start:236 stop:1009 length:774 start_codon:yes stop_codon:yes gene_type:complete